MRTETSSERRYRAEVRSWLKDALPDDLRYLAFRPKPDKIRPWYEALSEKGLIAPHWPVAEGGMGASAVEQVILMEELARAGAPELPTQGVNHIGPLLIKRGSPEQKRQHLPRILSGASTWCQGYSERNAGSDLLSLSTRARVEGDRLVIDGHKIWTTWGHHADWMFALVRTGPERHKGITFVLIDMTTPGITRHPIRTIAGDEEFAEVFLDSVEVPLENIVGEIGDGWSVATALLDEERLQIGSPLQANRALVSLSRLVAAMPEEVRGDWDGPLELSRMEVETVTAAFLDSSDRMVEGCAVPHESCYLKVLATESTQGILDRAQEAAGALAGLVRAPEIDGNRLDVNELFLQSRRLTIYGGSNDIQRNILATRVLEMNRGN